ncbi:MAG: hypothetical protein HY657_07475 [Acidobacteria bacterium]|nr:hypothetical protein [Acidobacteriota bacterium]
MSSRAAAVPVILVVLAGPAAAQTPPAPSVPEAAHFFGSGDFDSDDPQRQMLELWENVMAGTAVFAAFVTVTGFLAWLLKTFIDHRRWLQVSRVQTEAHNKLLDRLTGHEELLAYIQTRRVGGSSSRRPSSTRARGR